MKRKKEQETYSERTLNKAADDCLMNKAYYI
jgi:hypothetical protein